MADVGRPTDYTKELGDEICAQLADGTSLKTVCEKQGMPVRSTVYRWLRIHEEFKNNYLRAKEDSADALIEEMVDTHEQAITDARAEVVDPKAANALVSAYRNKTDDIKWYLSKIKPKKYGDKLDLTTLGNALPVPILGGLSVATDTNQKPPRPIGR